MEDETTFDHVQTLIVPPIISFPYLNFSTNLCIWVDSFRLVNKFWCMLRIWFMPFSSSCGPEEPSVSDSLSPISPFSIFFFLSLNLIRLFVSICRATKKWRRRCFGFPGILFLLSFSQCFSVFQLDFEFQLFLWQLRFAAENCIFSLNVQCLFMQIFRLRIVSLSGRFTLGSLVMGLWYNITEYDSTHEAWANGFESNYIILPNNHVYLYMFPIWDLISVSRTCIYSTVTFIRISFTATVIFFSKKKVFGNYVLREKRRGKYVLKTNQSVARMSQVDTCVKNGR